MQNYISEKWLKLVIKNNLIDQLKQIWNSSIETSSKGGNYKLLKGKLKFENYLAILEDKDTFTLCRFKTTGRSGEMENNYSRKQVLSFMFKNRIGRRVSLYF